MDKLIETLKDFITRDLLYVVGGGTVGLSFCFLFDVPIPQSPSTAMSLLAAGIAYGIGYAIQDGLSLTRIVTTAPVVTPGRVVQSLYRQFVRTDWSQIDSAEFTKAQDLFTTIASDRDYTQWNRIVSLKHIGSTLGSSGLVAALLLVASAVGEDGEARSVALALGSLVVSLTLIALSWVKGAQQSQFVLSIYRRHVKQKGDGDGATQEAVATLRNHESAGDV